MAMKMSMKKMSAMKMAKMSSMKMGMKGVNAYFTLMLDAKKKGLPSFVYNGTTYKQVKMKTGMITYKKK